MREKKYRYFMGDFETTVYDGQERTDVWASAVVELYTEDVQILHSISDTWEYLKSLNCDLIIYYHNLKFDGTFWLDYFLTELKLEQAIDDINSAFPEWVEDYKMENNTIKYTISDLGQWYRIRIKVNNHYIEIRDSLKLLPFSVKRIGNSFKTKHKKLDMEYKGFRYPYCEITPEEQEYIKNDVLVIKEALEIMFNEGHNKLTIGSCCLAEYKYEMRKEVYNSMFPDLYDIPLNAEEYGADNADEYIRKSYHGGWCYVVKGKERRKMYDGCTADVNSLYPSMMHSQSGNSYPTGKPKFWKGNYIPEEAQDDRHFYFVRIRCRFRIKKNKLPFVQMKGTMLYNPREMLTTSDFYIKKQNRYVKRFVLENGTIIDSKPTMTMTQMDYELFLKHYEVEELEILDGCYFMSFKGIFDTYIDKYKKLKMESTGALRELAKLFLNNLYGKMASSKNSSFKLAITEGDGFRYETINEEDKQAGYIAVGSAITSYARCFTITAAQKNYHGVNARGFIYADTDSIHTDLNPSEIKGIRIDDKEFCCWKIESEWDVGWFVRPKTYIEHIVREDGEECEPKYNVKCAGMPEKSKEIFLSQMNDLSDFDIGLKVSGKLLPKRIKGGVVLVDTDYEMR